MTTSKTLASLSQRAFTPWVSLILDWVLLGAGLIFMAISYGLDVRAGRADWFQRSGAVAVTLSGILAYRSLTKHYRKFFNDVQRGFPLRTSRNQSIVDWATLLLTCVGTLVWSYGDKLVP